MKIIILQSLLNNDIVKIEKFILENDSKFNPLFSSPIWAERLKKIVNFEYEFLIIEDRSEIVALHLIFKGFRGYAKINKLPYIFKLIGRIYAKKFYSYINWNNFIIFKNGLDKSLQQDIKLLIYKYIDNIKNIQKSPIYDSDEKYFQNRSISNWGTFIIDIEGKNYEEVYAKFRRQARKSIEKTKQQGVYVKLLEENDIEKYVKWLKENQKETGKSYKIDIETFTKEFETFNKENYIYEIFVAYQDDTILGSLGVWGYHDFISEWGVYQSRVAKEKKLYVQDVIKDSIVKYMFENGIRYYDLAGFNPNEEISSKEKAIKQFKTKFRGEEILYKIVEG